MNHALRLLSPLVAAAVAAGLLVVVLGIRPARGEAAAGAELRAAAAEVGRRLEGQRRAVERIALGGPGQLVAAADAAAREVGLDGLVHLELPGARTTAAVRAELLADIADEPEVARAIGRARDEGRGLPAAVDLPGDVHLVLWAAPTLPGELLEASVAARRAATTGVVLASVDVASTLAPIEQLGLVEDVAVFVEQVPLTTTATADEGVGLSATVGAVELRAVHRRTVLDGVGSALLALAALVIGLLALEGRERRRAARLAAREREAQQRRVDLVLTAARILQTSLDLASVVPAFAVQLIELGGLRAVAVDGIDDGGTEVTRFATGDWSSRDDEHVHPLRRGGRQTGALRVRHDGEPTPRDQDVISLLADLLASAVANADALERERIARRQLHGVDRLRTEFLGTVTHELRTSSTTVSEFARLLDDAWDHFDHDERRMMVGRLHRNASGLERLVLQLLDFSRVERHAFGVRLHPVDVGAVVLDLTDRLAPLLDGRRLDLQADEGVLALADPEALERILSNFLTNAARYAGPGTTVTVAVLDADRGPTLRVDDEGPGVAPEDRDQIFERFYRGESAAALQTRGAGIGLALVKELADQMGADVGVSDAPAGGARFELVLRPPDTDADAPTDATVESARARA